MKGLYYALGAGIDAAMGAINIPHFPDAWNLAAAAFCWTIALVIAARAVMDR